ncbi:MAG: tetratricopeptide repeat protein [Candidatus Thiodiazotropha lotti]|nr:tetratricopeptide repeat protein [Candidatus Thiodiazotropha lotti]MCG8005292.1 tetratricopeptide repeat protein [Candidatus Thiodiazotropha lotti]MCG8006874.1 tetratricopeptide repeat protein [Candidatus Thiodiazotropha lotti]MCW4188919.1 tetratricopeptide repeat protein [Candidatus Thiodiazotropha lotti]MCW4194456.1 tetratricopeptide repeat protein [Candidatus Thiodiazotropha lotti]
MKAAMEFVKSKNILFSFLIFSFLMLGTACTSKENRKQHYFDRGIELYNQGNYTKARLEFKNVLQIDPQDADAYYMFGLIEEKEENWRKAFSLFFRAVELKPEHQNAQVHLGTIYVLAGDTEKALEAAETVLKTTPDHSEALVLRGFALAKSGENEAAIEDVLNAFSSDPGNVEAASLLSALYADRGELDRAIQIARDSLTQHKERVASYLLLARLYAKANEEKSVIQVLTDLILSNPTELQHRLHLVSYYEEKGDKELAEAVLRQAVNDLPRSADAKLALVSYLKSNKDIIGAESLLSTYVVQNRDNHTFKLELAKHHISLNRKAEAIQMLSDVINQADLSTDGLIARTLKASILVKEGSIQQASQLIEEVLEADPKYKDALLVRAGIALVSEDPDRGIADLRTLLREDPGHVKAHRLKARSHLKKGEVELARQSLEDAVKAQPQETTTNFELVQLLIQTGELDDAEVVLQKMLKFAPKEISVLRGLGIVYLKQKKWGELLKIAKTLQSEYEAEPIGYYYQGLVDQNNDRLEQSVISLTRSLELKPGAIDVLVALAKSYFGLKQADEALKQVNQAVTTDPNHYLAYNLLGEIHLSQKRLKEADKAFERSLSINEKWPVPYRNLVKVKLMEGKQADAVAMLRRGYQNSLDPALGIELANTQDKLGQVDESIQIYQQILDKNPDNVLAANNLAMILLRGKPDQTKQDQALKLVEGFSTSENPIVLDTLGWTHYKRGETDKAISVLRRALRKNSNIPEIDYHLALAYKQIGNMDAAKTHLDAALSSGKPFEGISEAKSLQARLQ